MGNHHGLYITDLDTTVHSYTDHHFCRGNSSKRKSRFGLIEQGSGVYTYLNTSLSVEQGDVVFIPQNVFCHSEWHGNPDIKVTYINCFMYNHFSQYNLQKITSDKRAWNAMQKIYHLLSGDSRDELMAYSEFYKFLCEFHSQFETSPNKFNAILDKATNYIISNWNQDFAIKDIAKECCVCESRIYQLFRDCLGMSPIAYLNQIKINYAILYLEKGTYSIAEICHLTNFHSENHFRKVFQDIVGTTPLKYKKANIT